MYLNAEHRRQQTVRWTSADFVEHKCREEAEANRQMAELGERMLTMTERIVDLAEQEEEGQRSRVCTVDYGDLSETKRRYQRQVREIKAQLQEGSSAGCGCEECKSHVGPGCKSKARLEHALKCAEACLETIEGLEATDAGHAGT